jgi:hypothetical protein
MEKMNYHRPKNIPKELFHGTSMSRWKLINGHGLVTNIPKIYLKTQEKDNRIYLSLDPQDATHYALKTSEMEKKLSKTELKKYGISKIKDGGVIISIDTSTLNLENLFFDPEDVTQKGWFVHFGNISANSIKKWGFTSIKMCDDVIKSKIYFDIEFSSAWQNNNIKKIVDLVEESIKTAKELNINYDILAQLSAWRKYDDVTTGDKIFQKVKKEIEERNIFSSEQLKKI